MTDATPLSSLSQKVWKFLCSFQLTIAAMSLLMMLVVLCTLAQVELGTLGAVKVYMRSWIVWWGPHGAAYQFPIFPGGALVGLALLLNLTAAMIHRLQFTWAKAGLWIVHAGMILLFVGEFVAGTYQQDMRMEIETGETVSHLVDPRAMELVLVDTTDPATDDVIAVPASRLAKGGTISLPGSPLTLNVKAYWPNADVGDRQPNDPPSGATAGVGPMVGIRPMTPVSNDNEIDLTTALVEPVAGGKSHGVFLANPRLSSLQGFVHEGRTYQLKMRARRLYLPYSLTLKKFRFDRYPGTNIPKNFSSLIQLQNPAKGESREVLIFMNQPLRYEGRAFYQASFNQAETQTVLQVVENPGWLIPYLSCILVTLGLVVHFAVMLQKSVRARRSA